MDDREIIRLILSGKHEQFSYLVQRYQEPLIHFLRRLVNSEEDAFDCAQEAFLAAYRNLWRYSEEYPFRAWLYAIARNKAMDLQRKRKRQVVSELENTLMDPGPGPEEQWLVGEESRMLERALNNLPENYKQVLYLRYKQDLSYEEIAQVLNIPISRVKTHLHRGKERLRAEMDKWGTRREEEGYPCRT